MAATLTLLSEAGRRPTAPTFHHVVRVQGDNSYPTGGYAVDLDALGVKGDVINAFADIDFANGWYPIYVRSTKKVKLLLVATGIEVGNAVDVTNLDVEVVLLSQ